MGLIILVVTAAVTIPRVVITRIITVITSIAVVLGLAFVCNVLGLTFVRNVLAVLTIAFFS